MVNQMETLAGKLPECRGSAFYPLKINRNLHFLIWHTA